MRLFYFAIHFSRRYCSANFIIMSQINDAHGQYFDYCPCFGKRKQPKLSTKPIIYMEENKEGMIVEVPVPISTPKDPRKLTRSRRMTQSPNDAMDEKKKEK